MIGNRSQAQPVREARSLTATAEKQLLVWIAKRLPGWVSSDQLTALGFVACLLGGVCYRLSAVDPIFLHGVNACLLLNWFGDSLDGTLARVRRCERPRYGFYVDHLLDAVGIALLCAGLAFSGLANPGIAATLLIAYLLFSAHIALAAATGGVFRIAYGGLGGTELRILLAIANLVALEWPRFEAFGFGLRLFDILASGAAAALGVMLAVVGLRTGRALDRADRGTA